MNTALKTHPEFINDPAGLRYQIVTYAPAFDDQIAVLQHYLWGPDVALNLAYLDWKYKQNPYIDEALIYLALCDGEVVGMLGSFGLQWEIDQATNLCSVSLADLVVEPAHRNHQLFPTLIEFALLDLTKRGYSFVLDLTASPEVALVMLMNGWRSLYVQTAHRSSAQQAVVPQERVTRLQARYRQLRSYTKNSTLFSAGYQQLRQLKQRLSAPPATSPVTHPFQRFDQAQARHQQSQKPAQNSTPITGQMTSQPAAMAALSGRLPKDRRMRHVRDETYFHWRYQNPLSTYRFLFWENPELEGYLVLQTSVHAQADTAWVNIVDWEATTHQVQADLLQTALTWGQFKEVEIWSATLAESAKQMLEQAGFRFFNRTGSALRNVRGARMMLYSLQLDGNQTAWTETNNHLLDWANWDIRMVDSDAV
ncbi:MAG: GNAT family N-acetyltransferase [Chloroflexi bacterium]|nr:GNAT family N-acetyltransferase [Chloroflexota bacterium]